MATEWNPRLIAFIIRNPDKMNNNYLIYRMVGALLKQNIVKSKADREWLEGVYERSTKRGNRIAPLELIGTKDTLLNYVNQLADIAQANLQTQ